MPAPSTTAARSPFALGLLVALFSAATFGSSGTFGAALLETGWTPGALVTARITGAALCVGIAGKTTALQSLALSVCTLYPPTRVQLAIADTQNGITSANATTGPPPHVVAHFAGYRRAADPPASWDTWCAQVEAALNERTGQSQPELLVVVDAVADRGCEGAA